MEQNGFFQTKAGHLTIAFLVIAVAFVLIVTGLQSDGNGLCTVGFLMIVAAMLYSPVKVYLIDRMYRKYREGNCSEPVVSAKVLNGCE